MISRMINTMMSHAVRSRALLQVYFPQEKTTRKEIIMETLRVLIKLVIALDITSLRWGIDSTEKLDSPEWERRATWYAHRSGRESER
jgi:hypothetical protein